MGEVIDFAGGSGGSDGQDIKKEKRRAELRKKANEVLGELKPAGAEKAPRPPRRRSPAGVEGAVVVTGDGNVTQVGDGNLVIRAQMTTGGRPAAGPGLEHLREGLYRRAVEHLVRSRARQVLGGDHVWQRYCYAEWRVVSLAGLTDQQLARVYAYLFGLRSHLFC